ncbi:MAG: hypothetical protein U0169_05225 [Polyangiaceae bacterium]
MPTSPVRLRSFLAAACLATAPFVVACGSGSSGGIAIQFGGQQIQEQYGDPTSQQTAAHRELTNLVGHPLAVDVDEKLAVRWGATAHESVRNALVGLTGELKALKTSKPEIFTETAMRIQRIAYVHSSITDHTETTMDPQKGTLTVVVSANDPGCACGTVLAALAVAHDAERVRTYENASLDGIADKDIPKYFAIISRHTFRGDTPSKVTNDEVATLERYIGLHKRLSKSTNKNPELIKIHETVGKALGGAGASLAYAYKFHGGELGGIHGGKPFRRFESAWCNFFKTEYWNLPAAERNEALKGVFRVWQQDRAFPGIDRTALATDIVSRWVAAGSPVSAGTKTARTDDASTFDAVLCPRGKNDEGQWKMPEGCATDLYSFLKADDARMSAFTRVLSAKKDERASESIFANVQKPGKTDGTAVASTGEETNGTARVAVTTPQPE